MRSALPRGSDVLVLNYPGDWLSAQFAEPQFRWLVGDPTLRVRVLTAAPFEQWNRAPCVELIEAGNVLRLRSADSRPALPVADNSDHAFESAPFAPGRVIQTAAMGFEVHVVLGAGRVCDEARFVFPHRLDDYVLLDWRATGGTER